MPENEMQPGQTEETTDAILRYVLEGVIDEDQRKYIEDVREWLRDSLEKKERIMGECI